MVRNGTNANGVAVERSVGRTPRVASRFAGQPWAGGRNPLWDSGSENSITNMPMPILRHVANLWTFVQHPSKENGFDGVCWGPIPELKEGLARHGLFFLGGMSSGKAAEFPRLLQELKDTG